jgi:hypothetical protein
MTTALTDPISAEEFTNNKAVIIATLAAKDPTLDLSDGSAVVGLVVENEAQLAAAHAARYNALNLSFSLAAIAANLTTVDDAHVDSLISNYFLTRRQASAASGPIRVVTTLNMGYSIPVGFGISANAATFATTSAVRVYPTGALVTETASVKKLVLRADGKYEFTLTVLADAAGSTGMLSAGTAVTLLSPMDGMETATVATDFTGGTDKETSAELLARAQAGITATTLAGPEHIQAALSVQLPGIQTAVLGIGSPLMTRNRANVFGISIPGTEDIYVKTSAFPQRKTLTVQATAFDAARSMAFTLVGEAAAGVYRVMAIRPTSIAGIQGDPPTSVTPMIRTDLVFTPKTRVASDYIFGGIADLRVVFTDTSTPASTVISYEDSLSYDVDLLWMPEVSTVGDYCYGTNRPAGTDYLVKAGVPCLVDVTLTLRPRKGTAAPSVLDVQTAVAAAINGLPFGTPRLSLYVVIAALQTISFQGDVVDVLLSGEILAPTGANLLLQPSQGVEIPADLDNAVSSANTFFTAPTSNIEVIFVS